MSRLALLAALAGALVAQAPHEAPPPQGEILELRVEVDREGLQRLVERGFNVDHFNGTTVEVYVTAEEREILDRLGYPYTVAAPEPWADTSAAKSLGTYHSYAELTAELAEFADTYPDITRLTSLGKSVQGRELWALLITDHPAVEEEEPEFKYIATMHGDEPVGTELCLYLIAELLSGYGTDSRLTTLVDSTAIWFLPLMNPDGLELNRRFNANNIDLNRAFPEYPNQFVESMFDGGALSIENRQPEIQRVMFWTVTNSFVLSANFHTGAVVVNYPYDFEPGISSGQDAPTPDDPLCVDLSLRYAELNPPMFNSNEFENGITNGSAWYSITGGMQDWNYRYTGCLDVTIELAVPKRPAESLLPQYWAENRDSMLAYLEAVHYGIRGVVTDRRSGEPVWAKITIGDNPQPVFSDPDVGDYYRLALAGTYTVRAEAPGYIAWTQPDVALERESSTRVDIALSDGDVNLNGAVDAADIQMLVNGIVHGGCADCDVDGGGVSATDLQAVINVLLGR